MIDFPINWMGSSGPHEIVVPLSAEEVMQRLQMSLVKNSMFNALFDPGHLYTGEARLDNFWMRACQHRKWSSPILAGAMRETDGCTQIAVLIQGDHRLYFTGLLVLPVLLLLSIPLFRDGTLVFSPWLLPIPCAAILAFRCILARIASKQILDYFLGLFAEDGFEKLPH